jgi:tetratricopeptide (TPR) repeat protein
VISWRNRYSTYLALSSTYLELETEPERALLVHQFGRDLQPRIGPLEEADYAVMLAFYGEFEAADGVLQRVDARLLAAVPEKASVVYDLAQIARLRGELAKAQAGFEQVVQIDPNGNVGCMAREMLQKPGD